MEGRTGYWILAAWTLATANNSKRFHLMLSNREDLKALVLPIFVFNDHARNHCDNDLESTCREFEWDSNEHERGIPDKLDANPTGST
ncbi:Uncharacterized protein APZ42_024233 [Daphnia magna]|uniref:Uncharacterized protein n=1 Tax=Daphnia magna TaxID=35525 RepID=A0A164UK05_9CRUS|nr:Uncharacterized protein APZ42_024233 [Daphnia magna]